MLLSNVDNIPGKNIVDCKGFISADVVAGISYIKDIGAGIRNLIGGRSKGYEEEIANARQEALRALEEKAVAIGANAIIGLKFDYETMGVNGSMIYVVANGTAVVVQ